VEILESISDKMKGNVYVTIMAKPDVIRSVMEDKRDVAFMLPEKDELDDFELMYSIIEYDETLGLDTDLKFLGAIIIKDREHEEYKKRRDSLREELF